MLTKDDIKLMVDNFITREEFKYELGRIREDMVTKDDHRKVMGLVESVYTEVKKIREEQSMHVGMHERVDSEIDSIKKRVQRLESPSSISHRIKA